MQGIQPARSHYELAPDSIEPSLQSATAVLFQPAYGMPLQALPDVAPRNSKRSLPLIVRVNRLLRTILVTFCGLALLGYGLDVASSSEVAKLQEQARRLSEQNTELSAQLLRVISFQGIQASVVGRAGLRVPEHVVIVKEAQPPVVRPFRANKHYLPLMAGY